MRNYPLRNKQQQQQQKQASKKLAYILSRISEPPSYRERHLLHLKTVCGLYKTCWHSTQKTEKKMYIFHFTLTLNRWKKDLKNLVSYDVKITVLIFYIRSAFMPFNGRETWKGSERSDKHYHILHFSALPDAPLEHPHECEGVGQCQANLPSIYSWNRKKGKKISPILNPEHKSFCHVTKKIPL